MVGIKILSWIRIVCSWWTSCCSGPGALIQHVCCALRTNTHANAHTRRRSHLFSSTPHKQHLWFSVNYVYNWLNPYTSRQSAFHLFLYTSGRKGKSNEMKWNNIRGSTLRRILEFCVCVVVCPHFFRRRKHQCWYKYNTRRTSNNNAKQESFLFNFPRSSKIVTNETNNFTHHLIYSVCDRVRKFYISARIPIIK